MHVFLLAALSLLSITIVFADPQASITQGASFEPGVIRAYQVVLTPNNVTTSGVALSGIKIAGAGNAQQGAVSVDALHIAFVNPNHLPAFGSDGDRRLAFYVGRFSAAAAWDQKADIKGGLAAALQEVVANFDLIFVYFDHDGKPGFQFKLGNYAWDCTKAAAAKYDCYNPTYQISLAKDLNWTSLVYQAQPCPTSNYDPKCQVHTFTTTGSMNGTAVATFIFKLANQPVLVDGVEVSNDWGKIDVRIIYPWDLKGVTETNARIGLLAYSAGKAGVLGIVAAKVNENDALVFAGAASLSTAFFSWAGDALLNGATTAPVYVSSISGDQIKAYTCEGCDIITKAVFDLIKVFVIAPWEAFGWKVNALYFSWPNDKPNEIFWDPAIGVQSAMETDNARLLTPAIFLAVLFYFINYSLMDN